MKTLLCRLRCAYAGKPRGHCGRRLRYVPKIIDQHAYTCGPESTSSRASIPLEAKRLHFAGGFAAAGFAAGCVAWRLTGWDEMGWAWCWPVDTDMVDEIAAVAAADAFRAEIQVTWLVKHRDQTAVWKKIRRLPFKLTLRSSDTVHVSLRLIGSNVFLLRKESRTSHCNL